MRFLLPVLWYHLSSVQHVSGSLGADRLFHQLKHKLHYRVHQDLGIPAAPHLWVWTDTGKLPDNVGWKLLAWFMKEIKIWILCVFLSFVYAGRPSPQRSRPGPDEVAQRSNRLLQTDKAEWNLPFQFLMQEAELQQGGERGLCRFPSQALGHKRSHLHHCPAVSWGQVCSSKLPMGGTALLTCYDSLWTI